LLLLLLGVLESGVGGLEGGGEFVEGLGERRDVGGGIGVRGMLVLGVAGVGGGRLRGGFILSEGFLNSGHFW
jgi:hypothetical protein